MGSDARYCTCVAVVSVEISSTFQLTCDVTIEAGEFAVLASLGRSIRVVSVMVNAESGALVTAYQRNDGVDTKFAERRITEINVFLQIIDVSASRLSKTANLVLGSAFGRTTQVILHCTGNPAQKIACL